VVETDTVEGVLEGKAALDFVGLDHGFKNILNCGDLDALGGIGFGSTCEPVSDGKNTTEVVRRVAPLGSEPAVIVVKPSDSGANVESSADGVELVGGTWDLGTVWYNCVCAIGISSALCGALCERAMKLHFLPGTTGPRSFVHCSKFNASRPHPRVSIRHSLAVSHY